MEKKIISLRWELWKMYNDGFSREQVEEWVVSKVDSGEVKISEVVEALVDSRWEELRMKNKLEEIEEILK